MSSPPEVAELPSPLKRSPVWFALQLVCQNFFSVWLGYRAFGYEQLAQVDGGLVLANHQSFLDPLLVGLPLRRPISFLARDSLFRVPVVGWILRNTHVMSINQQAASAAILRESIRRLQHGYLVGIFPEGTRTETGAMNVLKPGFISIVRRAKRPLYPVGIAGAYQALPMKGWFLKPTRVRVVYGPPLSVEELEKYAGRDQEEALIELVRARIADCHAAAEAWRTTGVLPQSRPV
jgi:1-acyl-sn-glycerol-3-phosphate acyltransferase